MAFDKDAFLQSLDSMTVMELNDLVKAIEEKFGVSAASMAAPAAGAGGVGVAAAAGGVPTSVLLSFGTVVGGGGGTRTRIEPRSPLGDTTCAGRLDRPAGDT